MSLTPIFGGSQWFYQEDNENPSPGFYAVAKLWLNKITFVNSTTMAVNMRWGNDGYTGPTYQSGTGYTIYVNGSDVTGFVAIGGNEFPIQSVTVPSSGTFTLRVVQQCNVRSGVVDASTTIDATFTVQDVQRSVTLLNDGSLYRIFRLPAPSAATGKMPFFIKNQGSALYTFVHSNAGEAIDGITDGYVQVAQNACAGFTPSSSQWYIATYFANVGLPTSTDTGGTPITSPCVLVDFSSANKIVSLPNPATWTKGTLLAIGVRQSPTPGTYTCSVVTNGYVSDTTASAITITLAPTALTGGLLLFTNGVKWFIAGLSNGSDLTYTTYAGSEGRPTVTSPICLVQSGSNDGVTPPDVSSLASLSMRLGIVKLAKNAPFANGIVLQGSNWSVGQGTENKVFKTGGTVNYSAFVCLFGKAANTGATYAMHPVCTYPSVY